MTSLIVFCILFACAWFYVALIPLKDQIMCEVGWDGVTYCIGYILGFIPTYRMGELATVLCGLFALFSCYAVQFKNTREDVEFMKGYYDEKVLQLWTYQ